MQGTVIKSSGSVYGVRATDGTVVDCRVKGNFRLKGIRSTNPVAVGDHVRFDIREDGTAYIVDILERRNYIVRKASNLSKQSHILAANLDQCFLVVTISHPVTATTFIDRFLATCEAYRVPACLIFNKIDLLNEEELQELASLRQLYESLDYPTYAISALRLQESELTKLFQNRITLLSGNSGVGKSTLLNAILGKDIARTGAISSAHHKGMHTTTFSEMYPLNNTSWIIDTPGIKGFGMLDMERQEMGHYFREIFAISRECRYSDCVHINEPGCAVNQAVVEGRIAFSRYESYLSMLDDITENKYR